MGAKWWRTEPEDVKKIILYLHCLNCCLYTLKVWTLLQMQLFQSSFYNLTRVVSLNFLVFQKEIPPPGAVPGFFLRLFSFKQLQRGTPLSITVIQNKFNWNQRRGHGPANIICPKWCFLCFTWWEILANYPQWVSYSSLWSLQSALNVTFSFSRKQRDTHNGAFIKLKENNL